MDHERRNRWRPFLWYFGAWGIALILFDFIRQFGIGSMLGRPELDGYFLDHLGINLFYVLIESLIAALFYTKIAQFVFSPKFSNQLRGSPAHVANHCRHRISRGHVDQHEIQNDDGQQQH